jgi:hypothetical protein
MQTKGHNQFVDGRCRISPASPLRRQKYSLHSIDAKIVKNLALSSVIQTVSLIHRLETDTWQSTRDV